MPRQIWFVLINHSQVRKNEPLMRELAARGCDITLICMDEYYPSQYWAFEEASKTPYAVRKLPVGPYRPTQNSLRQVWQRRRLRRHLREYLAAQPIDAIIFGGDNAFDLFTMVNVARRLGIPTAVIPDGWVLPVSPRYRKGPLTRLRHAIMGALWRALHINGQRGTSGVDMVFVMNEVGRRQMIAARVDPRRVHVIGSPEYDVLAAELRRNMPAMEGRLAQLRRQLNIPPDRAVVCFFHQNNTYDFADARVFLRAMLQGAHSRGATLLVKLHPRTEKTELDQYRQWAAAERLAPEELVFVGNELNSIDCVLLSSVVVTVFSTVALEAMICQRPLVIIQYLNVSASLHLGREYGAAIDVQSPEELSSAIDPAIGDAHVRERLLANATKALDKELCGLDGKSASRCCDILFESIGRHP